MPLYAYHKNIQTVVDRKTGAFEYYLPKKLLIVKATYTLTKTRVVRVLKKVNKDGEMEVEYVNGQPKVQEKESYSAVIKDPIVITEIVIADNTPYYIDFSKLTGGGKSYKLLFAGTSQGILTGVNAEQTPVAVEIVGGVMGFVTKVVSVAAQGVTAGIFGVVSGVPTKDDEIQTESQTVEVTKTVTFDEAGNKVVFDPIFDENFKIVPSLTISYTAVNGADNQPADIALPVDGILYRRSIPYQVSITIEHNGFVKKAIVLTGVFDVPQKGKLTTVPLPIAKGKRSSAIAFDISTGRVTKFENNKESGAAATFSKINDATEELGKAAIELRKAQQDAEKDKTTQDQIDKLTLENELLEKQISNEQKKKELQKEKTSGDN